MVTRRRAILASSALRGGGDFGQRDASVPPRDDVPGAGNVDFRLISTTFDGVRLADLKQLGMKGAAVQLKR